MLKTDQVPKGLREQLEIAAGPAGARVFRWVRCNIKSDVCIVLVHYPNRRCSLTRRTSFQHVRPLAYHEGRVRQVLQ